MTTGTIIEVVSHTNAFPLMISHRTMGPRSLRKQQKFLQDAKKEQILEEEKEKELSHQNDCIYESTSAAVHKLAQHRLSEPCLGSSLHGHGTDEEAITFWSQQKPGKNNGDACGRRPLFAKCSSFTNDIQDGRLKHSEAS